MNILGLASRIPFTIFFFVFIFFLMFAMKRADRKTRTKEESFWERERRANSTRRKSLDTVDYVVIPYDKFPMDVEADDEAIAICLSELEGLRGSKIANFTGLTNTDLKLEYGAPNITLLMMYDANFTLLCRILHDWSSRLYELEHYEEALQVAEFAIKVRSDVSGTYALVSDLYEKLGLTDRVPWLKRTALTLDSAMQGVIIRALDNRFPNISETDTNVGSVSK